jgi:outer membrane biosynthesis protein TonB
VTVPRALPALLCLLALALGACGDDSSADDTALLARSEAQRLDARVTRIGQLAAQGRCAAARDNLGDYTFRVGQLPERRDPELRARLQEGAANLERTLAEQCDQPEPATESTATTETQTEPVPAPTETETEPTEPPATTDTTPVEPEPAPVPEPAPAPAPDDGGGDDGAPPGQGGTPPGQGGTPPGQAPDGSGGAAAPEGAG